MNKRFITVLIAFLAIILIACGPVPEQAARATPTPSLCTPPLRIVAASEVKILEDSKIFEDFAKETCIQVSIAYKGSVDIKNMVTAYAVSNPKDVDVFWAASPIWLPGTLVREKTTVMKTYVVFGVDKSKAAELGWDPKTGIATPDIIAAIRAGKLNLAMPSASQDDAGAIFYLAVLSSLKGGIVQQADLHMPVITNGIKTLFGGVSRSAASADALKQIVLEDRLSGRPQHTAVVLPESVMISLNRTLETKNASPFLVFYVRDATELEMFPFGYVEKISDTKVAQFKVLVTYLKSPHVQGKLKALGWRTSPVGMKVENADPSVFNPVWGIQADADFTPITLPKEPVIDEALNLFQTAFRKASNTIYCLDYSGSMAGEGEKQLKDAMDLLLDQSRASAVLLQATSNDVTTVFVFSGGVNDLGTVTGNDPSALKKLSKVIADRRPDGSTAMFSCAQSAIDRLGKDFNPAKYNYAVIVMTDGQSNTGMGGQEFVRYYQSKKLAVPVFGIAFGDARFDQLNLFKTLKAGDVTVPGDVCDGRKGGESLTLCFRKAKGSN